MYDPTLFILGASCTAVYTEQEAERRAKADFDALSGEVILVHEINGYSLDDNSHTFTFDEPIKVRVMVTPMTDIVRWMDEHLDPVWQVELVEPKFFENVPDGQLRSLWIHAPSYLPIRPRNEEIEQAETQMVTGYKTARRLGVTKESLLGWLDAAEGELSNK